MQQLLKFAFLVYLGRVVGGPFLTIGFLNNGRLGIGLGFAVIRILALGDNLDRVDMLACELPGREGPGNCNTALSGLA